jgi:hypothetical protein
MGQIDMRGVLKGGLAAAVLMNISQYLLNLPVAGRWMAQELAARNLPPAERPGQLAVFAVATTVLGFITVFVYAAIRPRLGPGPKTAMTAGLTVWAASYLYASILGGAIGVYSIGMSVLIIMWTAAEMLIASAVGGYLYNET